MNTTTKAAVVALSAASIVSLTTSPASALASAAGGDCGYGQTCVAYAQSVPRAGIGTDVQVSCTAVTPYTAVQTTVRCFVVGLTQGDVHWAPDTSMAGRVATVTHRFDAWSLTSTAYRVCVGAGVSTNTYNDPANHVCGPVV